MNAKAEFDPTGADAHSPGAKLDAGKPPIMRGVIQYFPLALQEVAKVSEAGARKYAWKGWETVPDGINRYSDALGRHLVAEQMEMIDKDTDCYHAAQVAWNALARLELMLQGMRKAHMMSFAVSDDFLGDHARLTAAAPAPVVSIVKGETGKPGC